MYVTRRLAALPGTIEKEFVLDENSNMHIFFSFEEKNVAPSLCHTHDIDARPHLGTCSKNIRLFPGIPAVMQKETLLLWHTRILADAGTSALADRDSAPVRIALLIGQAQLKLEALALFAWPVKRLVHLATATRSRVGITAAHGESEQWHGSKIVGRRKQGS
jgi:hypothetical protein